MNWYRTALTIREVIDSTAPNDRIFMTNTDTFNFRNETGAQQIGQKPTGLWYACGSGWLEFVNREFYSASGKYVFKIEINPSSMLLIDNAKDFERFSNEFKFEQKFGDDFSMNYINWPEVAQRYSGIEISPYLGRYRMSDEHIWYYSWDVASGCIWAETGIVDAELLHTDIEPADGTDGYED